MVYNLIWKGVCDQAMQENAVAVPDVAVAQLPPWERNKIGETKVYTRHLAGNLVCQEHCIPKEKARVVRAVGSICVGDESEFAAAELLEAPTESPIYLFADFGLCHAFWIHAFLDHRAT